MGKSRKGCERLWDLVVGHIDRDFTWLRAMGNSLLGLPKKKNLGQFGRPSFKMASSKPVRGKKLISLTYSSFLPNLTKRFHTLS